MSKKIELKYFLGWARDMAQWYKHLSGKRKVPSLIPRTKKKKEKILGRFTMDHKHMKRLTL